MIIVAIILTVLSGLGLLAAIVSIFLYCEEDLFHTGLIAFLVIGFCALAVWGSYDPMYGSTYWS